MVNFVIKKDGTREPFNEEKVRRAITLAAQNANLSEGRIKEVLNQVLSAVTQWLTKKDVITTMELREKILNDLDTIEPSVSAAWRKHDQEKKKT